MSGHDEGCDCDPCVAAFLMSCRSDQRHVPQPPKRVRVPAVIATEEPPMPSPCCGRGGFLHHVEDDE